MWPAINVLDCTFNLYIYADVWFEVTETLDYYGHITGITCIITAVTHGPKEATATRRLIY